MILSCGERTLCKDQKTVITLANSIEHVEVVFVYVYLFLYSDYQCDRYITLS